MAEIPELLNLDKLDKTILKAIEKIYVKELMKVTPYKTGFTAGQWEAISIGKFQYALYNPQGDIIQYLDGGTKAHTIVPVTKKWLMFPIPKPKLRNGAEEVLFAKTGWITFFGKGRKPVLMYRKQGSKYFCLAKKVNHPGFEGRHFIGQVLDSDSLFAEFSKYVTDTIV